MSALLVVLPRLVLNGLPLVHAAFSRPGTPDPAPAPAALCRARPEGDGSGLTYGTYLKVPELLGLQELQSAKHGRPARDELLFITIHQAYELWFKEVLFELDGVRDLFISEEVEEGEMLDCTDRLYRIVEILKLLVHQLDILKTMTPQGFMEFRSMLGTSSGFQSVQFRILENKLGVVEAQRIKYHGDKYTDSLAGEDRAAVLRSEGEPSLRELVDKWLQRTPGLADEDFGFCRKYKEAVQSMLDDSRAALQQLPAELRASELEELKTQATMFARMFDEEHHASLQSKGDRRLSFEAWQAALMIHVYRNQPLFSLPFQVLNLCQEIDTQLIRWRHGHAQMVQRLIGTKAGSGGSSGFYYLRATASDRYKVFLDLNHLSSYLIPEQYYPKLHGFRKMLGLRIQPSEDGDAED